MTCLMILYTIIPQPDAMNYRCVPDWPTPIKRHTKVIPIVEEGWASYYAPGIMSATVQVRLGYNQIDSSDIPRVTGFIARPLCHEMGDIMWFRPAGSSRFEPLMVADCARRDDGDGARSWMLDNSILIEVDWETWQRWGRKRGDGGYPVERLVGWELISTKPPPVRTLPQMH